MSDSRYHGVLKLIISACIFAVLIIFVAGCGGHSDSTPTVKPVTALSHAVSAPVVSVPKPPMTAAEAAKAAGCNRFRDWPVNSATTPYTIDGGHCWKNGKKYGINTFITKNGRDAWLQMAHNAGVPVIPKWETETSVIYPSVTS
ncbi:MAG TPA: hypothetical protein VGI71_24025 [Scandinavium sp.]|jgi:hypothetical protein